MEFIDLKSQYGALRERIDTNIRQVLEHGQYILGPEVRQLEDKLAGFVGVRHCVTVGSGTDALLIALMALNIGPGDEVITTPFTFIASAEVIVRAGAMPVLVDVEADTANMDATLLEAAITSRTRAIMPVSLYGQTSDMDAINAIAARHGIPVVEDAAQSFGASYRGRRSCNLSELGCTSFFPSKPLGCYGDGGALFTNDDRLAAVSREIRIHGQSGRYQHTRIGIGGRMDTIQCAVLLAKLERFPWELERRSVLSHRYAERLHDRKVRATPMSLRPDRNSVCAQYTVLVEDRDSVQRDLAAHGVPTAVHYPRPIHHQPAYQALCGSAAYPVSERLAGQVMSLPFSADLTFEDVDRVVESLAAATKRAG